ncbi:Hypothetical predicted protein [Mytilus galloprovincialis]|uniref:Helicase C-terminal domain-containing protein n=2 Tax=Mytilus galloprovincialis TaxID=29158 RepID=A0A8B6EFK7_MYTGA|nr:Hypothetical predicted protein [Mytilus galloprovincialis]
MTYLQVLRPFLLRRLKCDVEKQMPKKFEHVVMCHLSKRQRYLYEDFMSQGATRETLQSGHFMSVINVLMQLRKVCNHPSLFDPRPIISPFQAEGICYRTSSCVLKVLEYDPLRDIDLYSLYPSLADMEINLPAFVAHRVRGLQTSRKLIEEIDDVEECEQRPVPGKLQPTSFPSVFQQCGRSSPAITSTVMSNGGYPASSVPVMTPTVTTVSTPGLVTVASSMPVTSVVQTNKLQTKVVPQSGQTPVSTQPITVQIQQTDQGARLMIPAGQLSQLPAGFIQIVQTSLGQQMIATSSVSSVATTASAVVNGHQTITTTASSSVTATTMATMVRPSVQLPLSTMANQKPVMRVNPLASESQASSSIINVTDLSGSVKLPGTPLQNKSAVKKRVRKEIKKSEFYCNSLEEKKMREREQKLYFIANTNEKHCSRVPVYGQDLCHTVDVFRDMNRTHVKDNTWKGLGMVYCRNVHTWPNVNHPSYYWKQTKVLSNLINTPEQFLHKMEDILLRYTFITPPCTAPRIQMHVSHPPPQYLVEQRRRETLLQSQLSPKATCLHPISTRLLVQFPEKRLIQYDCGKLQVLDILLHRLKTEGHRVLIFTQMTKMLNILEAFLNYHGHIYLRLDGTTKVEQRQFLMDRFNADRRIFVFILSTRSGGIGVNLTGADTVIFYDSDWNPTMDAQAQDRCHRIGQTRDVHIYRLVSERTVEENILKKANQKRMLGDMAIEGGNFTTTFFKEQTIKDLFSEPSGLDSLVKEKEDRKEKEETVTVPPEAVDLKMKSMKEVSGGDDKPVSSDTSVITQFEKALAKTEDDTDAVAVDQVKAEQKAELAEFDENIPWDEREAERKREEDESKVEMELAMLEKELTPVERYAVTFMEDEMDPLAEELQIAEEDIQNAKKDWELGRLKALKEEEERRLEVEEDEMLFTYTREDAFNQVKKSAKKAKSAKAKTPARDRTPSARKRPIKKKDENYVIDEDKRRSDQGLSDPIFRTPKLGVGRPPKNKTPKITPNKQTPKSAKGRKSVDKVDVEIIDVNDTPKPLKSKRPPKTTPKMTEEEKAQTSKLVSKILAQANQKVPAACTPPPNITSLQQEQTTYSQQLLAQSQKADLSRAQLVSAMQKMQAANMSSKPSMQPQLLTPSQLQHLKQIISSASRNITPGQPLPQQIQGQQYITQSPVKSSQGAPVQQLFLQTSPNQPGQYVISQGQNMVPQLIPQHLPQIQQIQGAQTVVTPSFVQVQGRGGMVGPPTLYQVQGSQPGAAPSLVQIQQPQNIPAFLQVQNSSAPGSAPQMIQVQGSQQASRMIQATSKTTPTTQVVHFQTSPSALLAQIQASRVHGIQQGQRNPNCQSVLSSVQKTHPTIVQAPQGTQLVIPPSKQTPLKSSQFPSYVATSQSNTVLSQMGTTPSIINVQNMPQQSIKSATNKPTQYATVQDIQLVVTNASGIPKVVSAQRSSPAIQQARPQTVQVVASQASLNRRHSTTNQTSATASHYTKQCRTTCLIIH